MQIRSIFPKHDKEKSNKKVPKKHNAYFMLHVLLQNDQLEFNWFGHYSFKNLKVLVRETAYTTSIRQPY